MKKQNVRSDEIKAGDIINGDKVKGVLIGHSDTSILFEDGDINTCLKCKTWATVEIPDQSTPRTLDDLQVGDIIEEDVLKQQVLGMVGRAIFLSCEDNFDMAFDSPYTLKELKKAGYTLVQEEEMLQVSKKDYEAFQASVKNKTEVN